MHEIHYTCVIKNILIRNMRLIICPLSTSISRNFFKKEKFDTLIDRAQSEERFKGTISGTAHHISQEYPLKLKKQSD